MADAQATAIAPADEQAAAAAGQVPFALAPALLDIQAPFDYSTRVGQALYWDATSPLT